MQKKNIILVIIFVLVIIALGIYAILIPRETNAPESQITASSSNIAVSSSSPEKPLVSSSKYTARIADDKKSVSILNGKDVIRTVRADEFLSLESGIHGTSLTFRSVESMKNGEFLVLLAVGTRAKDTLMDFGIIRISGNPTLITHGGKLANVQGAVLSPDFKYVVYQMGSYVHEPCTSDLFLEVMRLETGELLGPGFTHTYDPSRDKLYPELGGYVWISDHTLAFIDLPRECNGAGKYEMQTRYDWNVETGTVVKGSY